MAGAERPLDVGVVGATGLAGQQLLAALVGHPRLRLCRVAASHRSAGRPLREALIDGAGASRWLLDRPLDPDHGALVVEDAATFDPTGLDLVFSAVDGAVAKELEARLAQRVPVVSTTSAFRYEPDVPLIVPQVNPEHAALLGRQRARGWEGFVAPVPNCTTTGLVVALAPLDAAFRLRRVWMTSMQAVSGAGRSPGTPALDVVDNVVPFIPQEEEKVERETRKILGILQGEAIEPHPMGVSATCTRVAVLDGHTESVVVELEEPAAPEAIAACLRGWEGAAPARGLPSAPPRWIEVHDDPYRPQPRLDREAGEGMTTSVGRIRPDPLFDAGAKFVLVSHNTKMGAGKGAVLLAELLDAQGLLAARSG